MTKQIRTQRLGEMLLEAAQIGSTELAQALELQRAHGGKLGSILVRLGSLSEDALYAALAQQLGYSRVDAAEVEEAAVRAGLSAWQLSRDWWFRQQALPWIDGEGERHVAASDPQNVDLRETLEAAAADHSIQWHFMLPASLERWHQGLEAGGAGAATELDARALRELAEDAPVISLVNNVLAQAVEARASDIHFEPGEREFDVRFRIDGVLHTRMTLPMSRYPAVASRVKLVSQIDIAERRLPQDGRTTIRVAGAEMDVRVSSIPAVYGESLVLRLLPKQRTDLKLERLGMEPDQLAMFTGWLHLPNGLVLVTGPTGSGKSTTLYGALAAINDLTRKIVTVEDPVEFRLSNVVQIQTQSEIGYTFARALRAILRHDPDVIMVGEIRDRETAEIAVQSALTGHLVLATLHTNDALSAVTRLVDMGIEPYLVAASLKAVMAQRLVRRLCPECSEPVDTEPSLSDKWTRLSARLNSPELVNAPEAWRRKAGCSYCQNTGFRGRIGIYELVTVSSDMQHRIAAAAPLAEVQSIADAAGRRSLLEDGLIKTRAGLTTFDEVLRSSGSITLD
jgi:general secretion pathway protein E